MCKCSVCEQAEQRARNTEANKTSSLTSKAESTFIWQFAHNSISDACQCSAFSHHTHCPYCTVNQLFVSPSSLQSQHTLPVPYCQPVVCQSIQPSDTTRIASTVLSTISLQVHSAFSHNTHCQYRTVHNAHCQYHTVNHFFASRFSLQSQHALPVPYCQPFLCKSIQLCIFLTLA